MEDKSKFIILSKDELDNIIQLSSKKLVGKAMKRFEIIQDPHSLKKNIKELIYENYRDFKDLLDASSVGHSVSIFDFKYKKEGKEKE